MSRLQGRPRKKPMDHSTLDGRVHDALVSASIMSVVADRLGIRTSMLSHALSTGRLEADCVPPGARDIITRGAVAAAIREVMAEQSGALASLAAVADELSCSKRRPVE